MKDGLHRLSREQYDALKDRANYSTLKYFDRSPAHYRYRIDNPDDGDTISRQKGRITHLAIFEPERFDKEIAVWDGGTRRGKEWEAFKAEHAGKELVRAQDLDDVRGMAETIRSHPDVAPHLAKGDGEVTALWTDPATGIECKAMLDWIGERVILDLKTTSDGDPEAFEKQAYNLRYHAQAAFYSDAVRVLTGVEMPFWIVTVESAPPYAVQVRPVVDEVLDAGRALYRRWLYTLAHCRETDHWPGYSSGPLSLCLPKWADRTGESFTAGENAS